MGFLVSISNFSRLLVPFGQFTSPIMHALITHRTWKKRWIIPMWSVQIPLLAISMIVLAILIGIEVNAPEDSFGNSQSTVQRLVAEAVSLLQHIQVLDMDHPICMEHSYGFSAWQERGWNDIYLYVAIGLSSAVFASFIASLTYSLVVFRTYRKRARTLYEKYSTSELGGSNSDVFYR